MKNRTLPRVLSVLLVSAMALGLCGCKGGTNTNADSGKTNHFFKTQYVDGNLNPDGRDMNTVKIVGDKLYYCSSDREDYMLQNLTVYDFAEDKETILWESDPQYNENEICIQQQYIQQFAVASSGDVYVYVNINTVSEESLNKDYSNATLDDVIAYMVDNWGYVESEAQEEWDNFYAEEYTDEEGNVNYGSFLIAMGMEYESEEVLIKLDAAGKQLYEKTMTKEKDENTSSYCESMQADAEGNLYLSMNEWTDEQDKYYVIVLDGEGNQKGIVDIDGYTAGMINNYDGSVSYLLWGETSGYDAYRIDPQTCKAEKTGSMSDSRVVFKDEEHFFVSDGSTLYLQSTKDDSKETYLNWMDYNISGSNVSTFSILSNGDIIAFSQNWMGEGQTNELIRLTEVDESEVTVATNITIACMWLDSEMEQKAIEFNKQHDDYHIIIRQFNDPEAEDWEASLNAFTTAVANDKNIDIIVFNDYSQVVNFASKGLMMDMYTLIDNDKEMSREDFMPNVLSAAEIDGKLVVLPTSYSLQTLVGKASDVGDEPGWTIKDMQNLLASKPEGTQLLYGMTRDQALSTCLNLGYKEFIDVANATCDFDNEDFVGVLEFANMFPEEFEWKEGDDETVMLNEGKVLLTTYYLYDFQQLQMYQTIFGEKLTYIGYPTTEGSGALMTFNNIYGITNNCKNVDIAWEFMRQFYLPQQQSEDEYYYSYGLSVRKDDFEKFCERAMKDTDENKGSWQWGSFEVDLKPATQEMVDDVKELVYATTAVDGALSTEVKNIIDEEAAYYFSGEQSAQDVAAKIQSRMQIYLSETK